MKKNTSATGEKPYDICISCHHLGEACDGPNFLAMEPERLSEWCRARKDYLYRSDRKWINSYIAEETLLSKTTVERFFAGNASDLRLSTIIPILRLLVGSWGQSPCAMVAAEKVVYTDSPELVSQCQKLKTEIEFIKAEEKKKTDFLLKQLDFLESQVRQKDMLLDERADYLRVKDGYIRWLAEMLGYKGENFERGDPGV